MKKNLIKNNKDFYEKKLDWETIQSEMKSKFGSDIYDSWLKKIEFIDEFNN